MANAAFPWFGGKTALLKELLPLIPDHKTYVEVFGGSGALLLAKKQSAVEIYNDLDSGLVNFFRVMRVPESAKRVMELCEMTPYSREEYVKALETWQDEPDDVLRAYLWYLVARWSFSGRFGKMITFDILTSTGGRAGRISKWRNGLKKLPQFTNRLLNVQIEHRDFRKILQIYDRPTTLFYLDPPYVPETRRDGVYTHELEFDDHVELVERLLEIEGMAILSGYAHEVYEPLEAAGWVRYDYETVCWVDLRDTTHGNSEKRTRTKRVEVIWTNPACNTRHKQMKLFTT